MTHDFTQGQIKKFFFGLDRNFNTLRHYAFKLGTCQLGLGRGRGVQGDWDVRLGGNNLRDLERTPDLDERSSGNPRPGRVCFAPGVCSIPMPRGEGARLMSLGVGRRIGSFGGGAVS